MSKYIEDNESQFLTVEERSYEYGKGEDQNEPCCTKMNWDISMNCFNTWMYGHVCT